MNRPSIPITKLIPNLVTIGALCCGFSAIRFAILGQWELAVTFVLIAGFLDAVDGRVARLLKATSDFGAQMDSLSDLICFGAAPALIVHLWILQNVKQFGWAVALIYVVCCALRLARFNTSLMEEKTELWQKEYFTGVPAPAGALLALFPLMVELQFGAEFIPEHVMLWGVMVYLPLVSLLLVSRLPTLSLKGYHIARYMVLPVMLSLIIAIIGIIVETWLITSLIAAGYLLTLPLTYFQAKHQQRRHS